MNNNTFFSILAKLVSNVSTETISEYASSSKEEANIYKNVLATAFSKKAEEEATSVSVKEINKAIKEYTTIPTLKNLYDLVGYTLIDLNNSQMTVEKNGIRYILDFVIDEGDCCGYSTIENNLFFKKKRKENPVITRVEYNRDDQASEEDYLNVTFFGMNKAICEINSMSSSGSGWAYGSAVTIKCKALQFEEMLTEW